MKYKLYDLFPVGADVSGEKKLILGGLGGSFLWAAVCFGRNYTNARNELYEWRGGDKYLIEGIVMEDFAQIPGPAFWGFWIVMFGMLALAVYHYMSHRQPTKSIYVMRRLPDKWELHRRCLTAPVLGIIGSLVLAFLALVIFYWIYMTFTPAVCLTPDQWAKIWR